VFFPTEDLWKTPCHPHGSSTQSNRITVPEKSRKLPIAFAEAVDEIDDPRIWEPTYPLDEILFVALVAVLCSSESYDDFESFGETQLQGLKKFFLFKEGIPSHDAYNTIPQLIETMDIEGAAVTIDAGKCYAEIAGAIVEGDGDNVITLKDNQPTLLNEAKAVFAEAQAQGCESVTCYQESDQGHGRKEKRMYYAVPLPKDSELRKNGKT
jgi:predicted transposase YbfD/YdcC